GAALRDGAGRIVRPGERGEAPDRRSHLRPGRRIGQHRARPFDVHGRNAGNGEHPAQRLVAKPRRVGRDRSGHRDVRRPEHRVGGCRVPGDEPEDPTEDAVRDALSRTDRPRGRHTRRRQLSRRRARVEGRHHLPAKDRPGAIRSQLRDPGGPARGAAASGHRARTRNSVGARTRRTDPRRTPLGQRHPIRSAAAAWTVSVCGGAATRCDPRKADGGRCQQHDANRSADLPRRTQERTMTTAVAQALRPAVRAALKGCATVLVLATSLHAATLFDPALHFRTITTEHFVIYFHQHEDRLGARLAAIAEDTWQQLREPLGVDPPRRTHVVLADQTELANGYATPVPYNTIVIYATWPRGSEFIGNVDDWLRVAFTHEFTHVVHLDRSEGWARVVRAIFGRTEIAFPNLFLPTWQIEGLATYEESAVTGEGRAHAGDFSAVIGEAARASRLEPLDRVNGGITDWPGGNAPDAYGVAFHEYLASRFGAEKLAELATRTARHVPYTGSLAFKKVFGESLGDLWRDYETSVSSLPAPPALPALPAPTQLTHQGFTITGPRFDPMEPAAIIYASRNADEFPSLYRVTLRDPRPHRIATRYLGSTVAIGRDTVYFDQQEVRRNVGSYSDLYALTRSSGHVQQLTHDARLLDPDLSPDGRTIVAVQARPGARDLVLVSIGSLQPPTITAIANEPETQFNAPRWAPDGRRVAVERHRPGSFSDVIVVDVEAHAETVVASFDDARVVTPAWRPDGRAVVAAVARQNAPFNLFEFPLDGGAPHQLTATTGGATWPDVSPDGTTIAYVGYTPHGFDLFTVPYAAVPRAELQPERRTVRSKPDITDDTTSEAYSPF